MSAVLRCFVGSKAVKWLVASKHGFDDAEACFVGSEAVKWLVASKHGFDGAEAVRLGNDMLREGLLHHVERRCSFRNGNFFYRFAEDERDLLQGGPRPAAAAAAAAADGSGGGGGGGALLQKQGSADTVLSNAAEQGGGGGRRPMSRGPSLRQILQDEDGAAPRILQDKDGAAPRILQDEGGAAPRVLQDEDGAAPRGIALARLRSALSAALHMAYSGRVMTHMAESRGGGHMEEDVGEDPEMPFGGGGQGQATGTGPPQESSPDSSPVGSPRNSSRLTATRNLRAQAAASTTETLSRQSTSLATEQLSRQPTGLVVEDVCDARELQHVQKDVRNARELQHVQKGKWRLGPKIGKGSYAAVYKALNRESGQLLAAKVLPLSAAVLHHDNGTGSRELAEVELEVNLLRSMRHPNIVQYLGIDFDVDSIAPYIGIDFDADRNALYIFCEWVPGGALRDLLNDFGPVEEHIASDYARQVLLGLKYLHDNHIVHRDIKCANLLMHENGHIKLTDFGASKMMYEEDHAEHTMRGTPFFMAPEVVGTGKYGRKADTWSFGGTVLEMLTGAAPWSALGVASSRQVYKLLLQPNALPPLPQHASAAATSFMAACLAAAAAGRAAQPALAQLTFPARVRDQDLRPSVDEVLQHAFVTTQPRMPCLGAMGAWEFADGGKDSGLGGPPLRAHTRAMLRWTCRDEGVSRPELLSVPAAR
ncbi:kinase-like domain-containing protein [Tribonema minus]|uniref:Kinase-like domain-containing protein n=1 Tax=Tribonema minus TaxID=303371 RepID=A0A835Z018_9STRA|nr:kinase-like domain-containing protein [Tribonema minus]